MVTTRGGPRGQWQQNWWHSSTRPTAEGLYIQLRSLYTPLKTSKTTAKSAQTFETISLQTLQRISNPRSHGVITLHSARPPPIYRQDSPGGACGYKAMAGSAVRACVHSICFDPPRQSFGSVGHRQDICTCGERLKTLLDVLRHRRRPFRFGAEQKTEPDDR